jgi:hypothetical protein
LCEKVIAFSRRELSIKDEKIETVKLDFDSPDENNFKNVDVGFNSFGTTIKTAGSEVNQGKLI